MADYTIGPDEVAAHIALEPGEITTVSFDYAESGVEVLSRNGASDIWYTLDGRDPEPGAGHCYVLPSGVVGSDVRAPAAVNRRTVVKLLATGACVVSVQRDH